MARYIDADALIEALKADYDREGTKANDMAMSGNADLSVKYGHGQFCYLNAMERVKDTPAADVAPKSEVEKQKLEIWRLEGEIERLKHICHSYALQYGTVRDQQKVIDEAKAEVAREIFEEIELKLSANESLEILSDGKFLDYFDANLAKELAELKKKYVGGD